MFDISSHSKKIMESAILKERDVFFFEMRYSVAKILLYFPIRFIIYASCTMGSGYHVYASSS